MTIKLYIIPIFFLMLLGISLRAQEIVPVAFGLKSPVDVNADAAGNLWITEAGTGANDGQVVRVNQDYSTDTIITALPSFFNFMTNEIQGALSTHLEPDGRIFVVQGAGPDTASASVIGFHLEDLQQKAAPLTVADARSQVKVGAWALANGYGESNPYSFVFDAEGNYIISDAAANAVFKYDIATQSFSTVADLQAFPNPLPFGPPFVDPVPTKILTHPEGGWLLGTLTGFPFIDGAARVYHLQADGSTSVYAEGLTLITDMAFDPNDGQLIVQEFAKFGPVDTTLSFIFGSAQMVKIGTDGTLDTLLAGYGPSAGMAFGADGSVYMNHLFTGQLLQAGGILSGNRDRPVIASGFRAYPNPSRGQFYAEVNLPETSSVNYLLYDQMGRLIKSGTLGRAFAGYHQIRFDFAGDQLAAGIYTLQLNTAQRSLTNRIVIE